MKYAGSTLVSEEEATDRAIFAASASLYAPFTLTYTSALQLDSNWTCGKYSGSKQERNIEYYPVCTISLKQKPITQFNSTIWQQSND